jgi:hypothetical protein
MVANRRNMDAAPVYTADGFFTASAAFTRPANTTAYAIGGRVADLTASATVVEFTNVARATAEAIRVERLRMRKTGTGIVNASFRVTLFRTLPVVNVNDGGLFNNAGVLALADIAGRIGALDVTMDVAAAIGAQGIGLPTKGSGVTCEAAGTTGHETSLWAVVEALAAYGPASAETFTLTIEGARS